MTITLYNSLSRKKEKLVPLEKNKIKMYVCGPTVYNYIHIGNARPAVVFDTVRRYLEYKGYSVQYVSNFTDIDDRLVNVAKKNNTSVREVADKFIAAYFEDVKALNVKEAYLHPRVTESAQEIILFIDELIKSGYAYNRGGDVYFKTKKFKEYGKLSNQPLDELFAGVRKKIEENKIDEADFALWKKTEDKTELHWNSPWSRGRPGWHIECSAMIRKHLGNAIDIHAGGIDLLFPHHENEIAQSEVITKRKLANYWMHNEFINIDNEKMSKSLGNYLLVKDLRKLVEPGVIRFWLLTVHYRHPINFSDSLIENAQNGYRKIENTLLNLKHRLNMTANLGEINATAMQQIKYNKEMFIKEMNNDFNTVNALTCIFNLVKIANNYLDGKQSNELLLSKLFHTITELTQVLGLNFDLSSVEEIPKEVKDLIAKREAARKERDFDTADNIRKVLNSKGFVIEDTVQGIRVKRV